MPIALPNNKSSLRAVGLAPIKTSVVPGFALSWFSTLIAVGLIFGGLTLRWINYYAKEGPAWINNLLQQKQLIADRKARKGPRLIVLGGSGVLFGCDAELIEKKLNVPTVNFGTHAGLGMRYILDRGRRLLKPGDTVLLMLEYGSWGDQWRDSPGTFHSFVWTYDKPYVMRMGWLQTPRALWSVPYSDYVDSYDGWKEYKDGRYRHLRETIPYNISTLSESGDIHICPNVTPNFHLTEAPYIVDPGTADIAAFRSFCRDAKARGIQVLYSWCSYVKPALAHGQNLDPPKYLTDLLRETGVDVLDTPAENMYPQGWYLDSEYHLNPSARRIRTEALIRRLRPRFGLAPASSRVTNVLLMADRDHRVTAGNLFADDPAVSVRYLWPDQLDDPRAITAAQVAELVASGINVYTDAAASAKLLVPAGLDLRRFATGRETLPHWFARHESNIIMLGNVPGQHIDPSWQEAVPRKVYDALASGLPTAALFGTGRYRDILRVESAPHFVILEATTGSLTKHKVAVPTLLRIQPMSENYGGPRLWMTADYMDCALIPSGICAVAIDPELGVKTDTAFFDAGPTVETWHLDRVVRAGVP
ncbi:MAG TPA: hypothetical protein VG326_18865 [Tepidisphaeraceae bacterium]|jgi:hypothetical protein|nr:hypothetical protein [Tepidisphaeraceae bacterium]